MPRPARAAAAALVASILCGCAPTWVSRSMGDYESWPLAARYRRGGDVNPDQAFWERGIARVEAVRTKRARSTELEVTLRRAAYISVVQILAPAPDRRESPVLFRAFYPWAPGVPWRFEPGRWIVEGWPELIFETISYPTLRGRGVQLCGRNEEPSLAGCWVREADLPGYRLGRGISLDQYIVLASEQPVDPYRLAYDLYFATLESDELRAAIIRDDAAEVQRLLELAIANRRGSAFWGGLYLTRQ